MKIIIGLGSNLGDRKMNISDALEYLSERFFIDAVSPVYSTESLLKDGQPDYYNIAVLCDTDMTPTELLSYIKNIEINMGRQVNHPKWGERIIDIDIIDYNGETVNDENLVIPHNQMGMRSFVLYPMRDICPGYIHPLTNRGIDEMIARLSDRLSIKKIY